MWVIAVVGVTPCRYRWFAGQQTMSPASISKTGHLRTGPALAFSLLVDALRKRA